MQKIPYLTAIGSLMYLATMTQPDIAYTAGILARFGTNPGIAHWGAVKHLLRYLKGTTKYALTYKPDPTSTEPFTTFSNADHRGCRDSGRSTGGYLVKVGTGAVCWSSKLQGIVALSSTEAEYSAAVEAGKEIYWMRNLMSEMGIKQTGPSTLHIDNQSAIQVTKNPEHHSRMKQLDLKFFWLRDAVERNVIIPSYTRMDQMPADILTKSLPKVKVDTFNKMLGLTEQPSHD